MGNGWEMGGALFRPRLHSPKKLGGKVWTGLKEVSAGGVVFRQREGRTEILLIEDRYSRWTLPKGKREKGETNEATALREIREETGISGRILRPLTTVHYRYFHPDFGDVEKEVHYYLVEATDETLNPALSEIRGARWFSPEEAWQRLQKEGYDNNCAVIEAAFRHLGLSAGES